MNRSKAIVFQCGLFIVTLAAYLSFPTKNYYWDGITFAQTIESAGSLNVSLIHPNHLFYEIFGYILYYLTLAVGVHVRALTVLQDANCVIGAASAVVVFNICKRALVSTSLATALTFLFAFSAMWWKFTTDADAYIPSVFLLLVSFWLILPSEKPRPFAVALVHALSMCFHQLAVFFFPVALLGIYFQTRNSDGKNRTLLLVKYAVSAFVLAFGAHIGCFYLQTGSTSPASLVAWITNHSSENGFVFGLKESLSYSFDGEFKLFLGGRFGFLKDMPKPVAVTLLLVLVGSTVAFLWQLVQTSRHRRELVVSALPEKSRQLLFICFLWIGVYLVFLFFWIPKNTFYRLFYLPPLILMIGMFLSKLSWKSYTSLALSSLVLTIALANFTFYIYPYSKVRDETPLALALNLKSIWTSQTVVYYSEMNTDNQLVKYFNPSTNWKELKVEGELENDVLSSSQDGRDVWIETTGIRAVSKDESRQKWLVDHTSDQGQFLLNNKAYYMVFQQVLP